MKTKRFNWGILGCSTITPSFVEGLRSLPNSNVLAIGSRDISRAKMFSEKLGIPNYYGSYEELVNNKEINMIYIDNTNNLHKESIVLCLNSGKHVLCEKPLTMNSKQTKEVIDLAKEKKLFLMEAMWTRFLPSFVKLRKLLKEEIIGDVKMIRADFGFTNNWGEERRLLNKKLGGGTLMDNGIYPISLASMIFNEQPNKIQTSTYIGKTGVDEYSCYLFSYESGKIATLSSTIRLTTPQDAVIIGTKGYILLPNFWKGNKIIIYLNGKKPKTIDLPFESTGYNYEAKTMWNVLRKVS